MNEIIQHTYASYFKFLLIIFGQFLFCPPVGLYKTRLT
jgi:hypothetical protein